jgi:hypothetical protein
MDTDGHGLNFHLSSIWSSFPFGTDSKPHILQASPLKDGRFDGGGIEIPAPAKITNVLFSKAILTASGNRTFEKIMDC